MFSVPDLLCLSLIPWLEPSTGSSRTTCMSNFSATDWVCGSFGAWVSSGFLINLDLPLFRVLVVGMTSLLFLFLFLWPLPFFPRAVKCCSPVGRGKSPLGSLGMSAEIRNESQSLSSHPNSSTTNNLINDIWNKFFLGWSASAWTLSCHSS
jgi:hypothetical protein